MSPLEILRNRVFDTPGVSQPRRSGENFPGEVLIRILGAANSAVKIRENAGKTLGMEGPQLFWLPLLEPINTHVI